MSSTQLATSSPISYHGSYTPFPLLLTAVLWPADGGDGVVEAADDSGERWRVLRGMNKGLGAAYVVMCAQGHSVCVAAGVVRGAWAAASMPSGQLSWMARAP